MPTEAKFAGLWAKNKLYCVSYIMYYITNSGSRKLWALTGFIFLQGTVEQGEFTAGIFHWV